MDYREPIVKRVLGKEFLEISRSDVLLTQLNVVVEVNKEFGEFCIVNTLIVPLNNVLCH